MDIKTDYVPEAWNEAYFVVVDPAAGRYWDENKAKIPSSTNGAWKTVSTGFGGANYRVGDAVIFKISLNTNVPSGKMINVSNLRWEP